MNVITTVPTARWRRVWGLTTTLAVFLLVPACATSERPVEMPVLEPTEPEPATERAEAPYVGLAGFSVEGRPIEYRRFGGGDSTVLILATIHGDEPAGTPLLETLARRLEDEPTLYDARRVVLVPVANPDGYAQGWRHNARRVDLNRNFPAENYRSSDGNGGTALSQPESRALQDLIDRYRPSTIVSIHQPLGCVDYDGPARELADRLASAGPLPVRKLGARPGSLGSWAGEEQGIPTITLELPRGVERHGEERLWSAYGAMLLTAIRDDAVTAK